MGFNFGRCIAVNKLILKSSCKAYVVESAIFSRKQGSEDRQKFIISSAFSDRHRHPNYSSPSAHRGLASQTLSL
jgi:hypothetical protein